MSLNWQNLKNNRDEILKAEIGSLLFNLGKTHIGIGNWKNYFPNENSSFGSYKDYYQQNYFENELNQVSLNLKDFIFNSDILINGENKKWAEYFKGDVSDSDIVEKVFFRGCENVNSGIDKGSPKEQLKGKLWVSNAFGSFKEEVKKDNFDNKRREFFKNLHQFLEENNYYENPDWKHIRKFVIKELKNWYTHLLSDSRMPVNDVTLYDQAYMSATMFKAALAGMMLETYESEKYLENPQSIKWQILGIQYDKLGLAEKGLKVSHISWYKETSKKVDDEIKKLIETDYTLGNEIYRDESGIYFLVPEDVDRDFENVKCQINTIFKENFGDEVYPYITFSKVSRGIMNLTNLLKKAKENFLKADNSLKSDLFYYGGETGICQVCKSRLGKKSKGDRYLVCDICRERRKGRIDKWLKNQESETIWIDEIADKNNRVALITLKFELIEWLNGDLLSSLLTRDENYQKWLKNIKIFLKLFYSDIDILQIDLSQLGSTITPEQKKRLASKNGLISGIKKDLGKLQNFLYEIRNNGLKPFNKKIKTNAYENILLELMSMFFNSLEGLSKKINELLNDNEIVSVLNENDINLLKNLKKELEKNRIKIFILYLTEDAYNGCKKWRENFDDYIQQIFFGSVVGTDFEEIIKSSLNTIIDWQNEKINWNELKDGDIDLLSKLLLQFILRKNPSPARLRRVWESTQEFFEKVKKEILETYVAQRTKESFKQKVPDFAYLAEDKRFKDQQSYKQYFSIIDPTPISWQFIVPTSKIIDFVKKVQKLYYKHFKYVNGKLPLHIGVVVQKSKDPLYVGIKALRNIRRDIKEWKEIAKEGKNILPDLECYEEVLEQNNNAKDYYSLYETENPEYDFMLLPSGKGVKKYNSTDSFIIYPNTIDFEFLDTNSRRNDIYYKNGKRVAQLKKNRPYSWEEFEKFEEFKNIFNGKTALLHRLVSLIYSKMEDWYCENLNDEREKEECKKSFSYLMKSTLKRIKKQDGVDVSNIFDIDNFDFNEAKKFIDMFEFWHTTLKEI
ncbi:CRISPR-associated protein Csx11 [Caminibacter pacificus]